MGFWWGLPKFENSSSVAEKRRSCAELYLAHHGHHVTSLGISCFDRLVQLPCANLQELELSHCTLQLGPDSDSPGILAACESLTQLRAANCRMLDWSTGLSALAAVSKLRHLKLDSLDAWRADTAELLMHVPKLTCLYFGHVTSGGFQNSVLQISRLTDLQSLTLTAFSCSDTCSVSPSTAPGFSCLTALTSIHLERCRLDPAILQHSTLPHCQSLIVKRVRLISDPEGPSAASAMLLSCIARMASLERVSLWLKDTQWTDDMPAYKGLTASSKLQTLSLHNSGLPGDVWQAMLAADRSCPHLTVNV